MTTHYSLKIERVDANGQPIFMSRGHHDIDEFLAALRRDGVSDKVKAEHVFFKPVPRKTGGFQFYEYPQPISGSFPVTRASPVR